MDIKKSLGMPHFRNHLGLILKLIAALALLDFFSGVAYSCYLQIHRPILPDHNLGFEFYMKFLGRPFYISEREHIVIELFFNSYIALVAAGAICKYRLTSYKKK